MPLFALSTFRARLLVGVLVPLLVVQVVATAIELSDLKRQYQQSLMLEAQLVARLVGESMVQPLWDFDMDQVQSMADRLVKDGSIAQAILIDPTGIPLVNSRRDDFVERESDLELVHPLEYRLHGMSESLGELVLSIPTGRVEAALASTTIRKFILTGAILALIGSALIVVLVQLSKPLVEISRAIDKISGGNLDLAVPFLGRKDEIGQVARALEQFRCREAEISLLRSQNDEISRRERKRIRRAIESTRDAIILADETGAVIYCNPNARKVFPGVRVGEPMDLSSSIDPEAATTIAESTKLRTTCLTQAVSADPKDGSKISLLIRGGPILDEDSAFLGTALLATDHTEQARQTEKVRYLSEHDSLTGLANRRVLERALARCIEDGIGAHFMLADLDNFKRINDTLGHPVGDALLSHVAMLFQHSVDERDIAVRLGGDEFAVLAIGDDSETRLHDLTCLLLRELSRPQVIEGRILHTGMSAGISPLLGSDSDPSEVLRRSDLALYDAKRKGRGRVEVFRDELQETISRKSLLESELRKALKNRDIRPVFQRQSSTLDGAITGFEALARWSHDVLGPISPAEFIPVAEETGLIEELTIQIMTEAFRAASEWRRIGFPGRVAVNVSPVMFGGDLAEIVQDCLFKTGCDPNSAEIEITETVVLSRGDHARNTIEKLRAIGVTVALDDFGMGYSSLSYLQSFPVDKIKIDRAFVSKLPSSEETKAIVIAIASLGHALGMSVTGEGAEMEEQRQCLHECGVDILQGFVDGMPLAMSQARDAVLEQVPRRVNSSDASTQRLHESTRNSNLS